MRPVLLCLIVLLFCSLAIPADGTIPRPKAANYPSHVEIGSVEVGALLLKEPDVKQRFAAKISDAYLVVEVAVYPQQGERIEVLPDNFVLRLTSTEIALRPESPMVVAGATQKTGSPNRDIRVIPRAEVGIQTGTRYPDPRYDPNYPGYDPTYDPRYDPRYPRRGGVYTTTGVGVILGGSDPRAPSSKGDNAATELSEKSLPSGPTSKPVAGHLYFRVDKKTQQDRNNRFSLEVEMMGKTAKRPL